MAPAQLPGHWLLAGLVDALDRFGDKLREALDG